MANRAPESGVVSARVDLLRRSGWLDLRWIGHGGMGELYAGYDPGIQRQVVAKFIRPDSVTQATRDRFKVEAVTLARLEHPNVARLFGYKDGTDPYLVMEYVDGGTLADRIRAGALCPREAAEILEGVARGVAAAHARSVIHRDVKPSNILLDRSGPAVVAKVSDFGMAKDVDAMEPLTVSNAVIGTPEFMSPEQASSRSAGCDARSDVWGLAATLYAAVSGHPPYTHDPTSTPVLTEPLTPPETHAPGLPTELAAVIRMGLEKHPNDRYPTAEAFADDLKRFLANQPVQARRRSWPIRAWRKVQRVPKLVAVSLLVAMMATAAAAAVILDREPTPETKIARKLARLADGETIELVGPTGHPVWSEPVAGTCTPALLATTSGTWGLSSMEVGVCQICPNVPLDTYELSLELCDVAAAPVGNPGSPISFLGLILGLERFPGTPTAMVSRGVGLRYRDVDARRDPATPAYTETLISELVWFIERPGLCVATPSLRLDTKTFLPSRRMARIGLWRTFRISVSPTRIQIVMSSPPSATGVRVEDVVIDLPVAYLNASAIDHCQMNRESYPVAEFPPWTWNPQAGIGLLVCRSVAGVRNVRLSPPSRPK